MAMTAATASNSRRLAIGVLCAGQMMIVLDQTIVNVALPSIQRGLGFPQPSLSWVVNAYLIGFGGVLLLAGRLGDLIGRKRIFMAGLAVFTVASLVCGLSTSQGMLIAARFVQGIGGGMSSAVILGMIVTMSQGKGQMAKAMGLFSFVSATGGALGPIAGGVLTQALNWHWIFFVNVPLGIGAAVLASRALESERGLGLSKGADFAGAALVTTGLMTAVYTIVEAGNYGWGSVHTVGFGALAIVLLTLFIVRQATASDPLMPLRIFRSRNLSGANLVQVLAVAGMFGFLFLGTLYLQRVLGYRPAQTGLAFVPIAVVIGTVSLAFAAKLMMRFGPRTMLLTGLTVIAVGLALFSRTPVDSSFGSFLVNVLPAMVLIGAGFGAMLPALMTLAMSGATPSDSGLASGVFNTTQQIGGALGLAVLATLATAQTNHLLAAGQSTAVALNGGYHLAFRIASGLVIVGVILAAVILRTNAPEQAAHPEVDELPARDDNPAVPAPAG